MEAENVEQTERRVNMALKVLMLRKKLDEANKKLSALRSKEDEFIKREEELATAIKEAETEEEQKTVEELEKDNDTQQLEKLLVQRFKLDEDADLELYLEELAAIHKGTVDMFKDNDYVDVLTTIAEEVKMIDSRSATSATTATNNNIIK